MAVIEEALERAYAANGRWFPVDRPGAVRLGFQDATAALRLVAPHPHPAHAAVARALGTAPVLGTPSPDHEGVGGLSVLALLRLAQPVQTLS